MGLTFENVRVLRRRLWLFVVFVAWTFAALVPWVTLANTRFNLGIALTAAGLGVQLLLGRAWNRRRRIDVGTVQVDTGVVRFDGRLLCTRASVQHVHVAERDGVWNLRIHRRWGPLDAIDVETLHRRDARALEAALGCGRGRSLTPFTVFVGYQDMVRWMIGATVTAAIGAFIIGVPAFFGWLSALGAIQFWHTWAARVGADGVELRRYRSVRYVAFADIADVRTNGRHLSIDRRIEPSLTLSHVSFAAAVRRLMGHDEFDFDALREAIEDGRAALATRSHPVMTGLARGARSVAEWMADLRHVSAGNATSYRAPAFPFELLLDVALDETQMPTVRIGALLALAPELDDDARTRLRLAAVTAASMEVRFALGAAGYGDENGLMKAAAMLR